MQSIKSLTLFFSAFCVLLLSALHCRCQSGTKLSGMTPMKWITVKMTSSPGRNFSHGEQKLPVNYEDVYAKMWIPVLNKEKFKFLIGPSYRTEQLEFREGQETSALGGLSHWNLRSAGLDTRFAYRLNNQRQLAVCFNSAYSATVSETHLFNSPLNVSVSALYMHRLSDKKERGFGVMYSNSVTGLSVLPVLVWNETFNSRNGLEISLPYKIAWRHNFSTTDIVHIKAEGSSRSYFINKENDTQFRRRDLDLGIAYTRILNKWMGFELFSGYRYNLSTELPAAMSVNRSGIAMSVELFVLPAFKSKQAK
jgi:hypothetical protein